MEYPPVSIVVAAYNAQDTIARCIESLLGLDYPEKEIIIINDGSQDKTKEIIERYPVTLISQENAGASAARNNGLKSANNEVVAYTDSDCVVSKGWLKNLVKHLQDPRVGAVTGRTIFAIDEHCTSYIRSLDIEERNARRRRYTSLANGPNSAFRKDLLIKLGGFNPEWYHAEDTEVSYKVWEEGYKIVYEPEAIVDHVPENDWKKFLKKRYRDAKAFTRILFFHLKTAASKDDFVTPTMKIQPPLFALIMFLPALIVLFSIFNVLPNQLFPLWLLLLALGIALNIPFSYKIYRRSKKPSFFAKSLLLTTARGFCWGLGLVVGGMQNLKKLVIKSSQ